MSANVATALIDFDIAVDGVQFADGFRTNDAQGTIDVVDVIELSSARNVNDVIDRYFAPLFLRVASGDGERIGFGININGDQVEKGLAVRSALEGADFDFILVPVFDAHSAAHIVEFERAIGAQRVGAREFASDSEASRCNERKAEQQNKDRVAQGGAM